jgi:hypothetical protein
LLTHSSYTNRTARTVTIEQASATDVILRRRHQKLWLPTPFAPSTTLFMCSLRRTPFNFAPSFAEKRGREDVGLGKAPLQIVSLGTHVPPAFRINFVCKKSATPDPFGEQFGLYSPEYVY